MSAMDGPLSNGQTFSLLQVGIYRFSPPWSGSARTRFHPMEKPFLISRMANLSLMYTCCPSMEVGRPASPLTGHSPIIGMTRSLPGRQTGNGLHFASRDMSILCRVKEASLEKSLTLLPRRVVHASCLIRAD